MNEFRNRVAVVTGAASGIGLALARALADHGATVVLTDVDGSPAQQRAAELGPRHQGAQLDVADARAFQALADRGASELGGAQVLVGNAGVAGPAGLPVWQTTATTGTGYWGSTCSASSTGSGRSCRRCSQPSNPAAQATS